MKAGIDRWSLENIETKFEDSISETISSMDGSISRENLDMDSIQTISTSVRGNQENLREACLTYSSIIPPFTWPRVFAGVSSNNLEWIQENGLMHDNPVNPNYKKMGIVAFRCPPHPQFLDAIAEIPEILALTLPESPMKLYEPLIVEPEMIDVRAMIGVNDEIQKSYGSGVRIAIIDSGIDPEHPDFPRLNQSNCMNFTNDNDFLDYCGHGTHVAGIAMGSGTASDGRYKGISPNSELVIAKVLSNLGFGLTEWIVEGLNWCAYEQHAHVMNLSLGETGYPDGRSFLSVVVDNLSRQGFVMCVAAGNSGPKLETICQPGDAHNAITVGVIDKQYHLTDYSSRGSNKQASVVTNKPNIVAPGHQTIAPRSQYSKFPGVAGGKYACLAGTSMATPVIAGCSALLISYLQEKGEDTSPEHLKELLYENAMKLTDPSGKAYKNYETGHGMVQVDKCMKDKNPKPEGKEMVKKNKDLHKIILSRELALINGLSGRLSSSNSIWHPVKNAMINQVKFTPIPLEPENASDRQLLYGLLLASGLLPKEIPGVINEYPQNPIRFWQVEYINDHVNNLIKKIKIGPQPNLWIGVFCYSSLREIIDAKNINQPGPARVQIITNRLRKVKIDKTITVVLFAGSTSGWEGNLTEQLADNIHCLYFSPSNFKGWQFAQPIQQIDENRLKWYMENMYPEDNDAINQRIRTWFEEIGKMESRWNLIDAAQNAGTPIFHMQEFFKIMDKKQPKMWTYHEERQLLISMNR